MAQFRSWWMFKYAEGEQFSLDCSNTVQMFKPEKITRPIIKRNYNSISLCQNMRTWGSKLSFTQGRTNQWNLGVGVWGDRKTDKKSGGQRTVERKRVKRGIFPLPISPIPLSGIHFLLCLGLLSLITFSEEAFQFALAWPLNKIL